MEMQCKRSKVSPVIRRDLFAYAAQLLRRGKAGLLQRARRLAEDHQRNTSSMSSPMEKYGYFDNFIVLLFYMQ